MQNPEHVDKRFDRYYFQTHNNLYCTTSTISSAYSHLTGVTQYLQTIEMFPLPWTPNLVNLLWTGKGCMAYIGDCWLLFVFAWLNQKLELHFLWWFLLAIVHWDGAVSVIPWRCSKQLVITSPAKIESAHKHDRSVGKVCAAILNATPSQMPVLPFFQFYHSSWQWSRLLNATVALLFYHW
jgi:hypothetical protein